MNTMMYNHPVTDEQIKKLISWGVTLIEPQVKLLACGDKGVGAMASLEAIVEASTEIMKKRESIKMFKKTVSESALIAMG